MGARVPVALTQEQTATLRILAESGKTEQRMALRAKGILLTAEGLGLREIEEKTGLNWQRCLGWRKRFLERGLEGLQDQAGRGRPQSITPEERMSVVALACTTSADGSRQFHADSTKLPQAARSLAVPRDGELPPLPGRHLHACDDSCFSTSTCHPLTPCESMIPHEVTPAACIAIFPSLS